MMTRLNHHSLLKAVDCLIDTDPLLNRIISDHGAPPLWDRNEGFSTLIHIILEQQVSLAAAYAAFNKLLATGPCAPIHFQALSDASLRRIGFSRQKAGYGRYLAKAILEGSLDLSALSDLTDRQVRNRLTRIKGIGPWTANIYLLMALGRPDVWPDGDIALASAYQRLMGKSKRPSYASLHRKARQWRPYRAVAARMLWHFYLCTRRKSA